MHRHLAIRPVALLEPPRGGFSHLSRAGEKFFGEQLCRKLQRKRRRRSEELIQIKWAYRRGINSSLLLDLQALVHQFGGMVKSIVHKERADREQEIERLRAEMRAEYRAELAQSSYPSRHAPVRHRISDRVGRGAEGQAVAEPRGRERDVESKPPGQCLHPGMRADEDAFISRRCRGKI
jgi:hypothetical protein